MMDWALIGDAGGTNFPCLPLSKTYFAAIVYVAIVRYTTAAARCTAVGEAGFYFMVLIFRGRYIPDLYDLARVAAWDP